MASLKTLLQEIHNLLVQMNKYMQWNFNDIIKKGSERDIFKSI